MVTRLKYGNTSTYFVHGTSGGLLIDTQCDYVENTALQNDWKLVMSYNPKVIYYAHVNEKHFA